MAGCGSPACMFKNSYYDNETTLIRSSRSGGYPFQLLGSKITFQVKEVKEGLFARVDMPGVGEYQVDVFVKDNTVFFKGVASSEYKDDPRTYLGSFDLSSHSDKMFEIKTEMKNGVLRILAPSVFTKLLSGQSSEAVSPKNMNNPFQIKGPIWAYEKFVNKEDKMFVRADMPGVDKESVRVWVSDGRTVFFSGTAPKLWEYEEGGSGGRSYLGSFSLHCGCCRFVEDVQFSVDNGVIQMLISKIKVY